MLAFQNGPIQKYVNMKCTSMAMFWTILLLLILRWFSMPCIFFLFCSKNKLVNYYLETKASKGLYMKKSWPWNEGKKRFIAKRSLLPWIAEVHNFLKNMRTYGSFWIKRLINIIFMTFMVQNKTKNNKKKEMLSN
jgi:hypothetical protein